ncbi:hypothetical protein [Streptomyces sp. MP131-18]|uniref:hypothetical protein n=1 Tax=Streptomyces sp. MP131-18 TaxID=1857892 RepID=UPI00097C019D|nr:hypothetical protein [Streptomyces sp. MP131-18]ONK09286.1 hypothetical protein STBA_71410 [Streptomyces sp. MP131-18]
MTHPKYTEIIGLLRQGHSNTEIARRLRCDRHAVGDIRRAASIPRQRLSLEEKWRARVREINGGHMEWLGERQSTSGTPIMRYREKPYTAAQIAFRIAHGREPQGYVVAGCGRKHCVAPEHVEDLTTRARVREQLRYLTGGGQRPPVCRHGHDQARWGRYEPDGTAYCHACKLDAKRTAASPAWTE